MSNSRSPRAVRSMTMGTSGMAERHSAPRAAAGSQAAAMRRRRRAAGARAGARSGAGGAAVEVQRLGDVGRRRAVDEHRQQREVVGLDAVRGGVELLAA